MTYKITALENTKARLIVSVTSTTDAVVAAMTKRSYELRGFIVVEEIEH